MLLQNLRNIRQSVKGGELMRRNAFESTQSKKLCEWSPRHMRRIPHTRVGKAQLLGGGKVMPEAIQNAKPRES